MKSISLKLLIIFAFLFIGITGCETLENLKDQVKSQTTKLKAKAKKQTTKLKAKAKEKVNNATNKVKKQVSAKTGIPIPITTKGANGYKKYKHPDYTFEYPVDWKINLAIPTPTRKPTDLITFTPKPKPLITADGKIKKESGKIEYQVQARLPAASVTIITSKDKKTLSKKQMKELIEKLIKSASTDKNKKKDTSFKLLKKEIKILPNGYIRGYTVFEANITSRFWDSVSSYVYVQLTYSKKLNKMTMLKIRVTQDNGIFGGVFGAQEGKNYGYAYREYEHQIKHMLKNIKFKN